MIGIGISTNQQSRTMLQKVLSIFNGGSYDGFILDASDISTLYQLSTGTTPVTAVNDPIGYFGEKSGNGNHAIQATAAARPTWQVDVNGHHLARFDGVDDSLSCATGGGGSTGFFWCEVVQFTSAANDYRVLWSDQTGINGYIVLRSMTTNKLELWAGNGATHTKAISTAALSIGTKYLLTCWDDGTNLNVQINDATVESVARPVVMAGTAGFTIGKDNGVASSFFIGDFYRAVYIKNWAGTAAQLAAIQSWVKAGAGL